MKHLNRVIFNRLKTSGIYIIFFMFQVYDSMGPSYGPAGIRGPPPNSMSPGGPGPGGMPPMSL